MSVLVDRDIIAAINRGAIVIDPFDRDCLGTNSYDVHLLPVLRVYKREYEEVRRITVGDDASVRASPFISDEIPLDVRVPRETVDIVIPDEGYVLRPNELYLASTDEYTESNEHLPILNGKSSLGRLGLSIHVTAGTGDVGFRGHWTMELFVIQPLRIYAGMAIGQLLWFTANTPIVPYHSKTNAKYNGANDLPQASLMHKEFAPVEE